MDQALDDRQAVQELFSELSRESAFPIQAPSASPSGHIDEFVSAVAHTLLEHGSDLRAAMQAVWAAGGDTDSVGAIVASCIGAQVGLSELPEEWAREVEHRDYLLWLADRLATPEPVRDARGEVVELKGDVAKREVDAIVNAWNRNLLPPWLLVPQGVSKAVRQAGGAAAIAHVGRMGPLPLGGAVETSASGLGATWLIHATAINLAWRASEVSVRGAVRSSLALAHWLGARTVALPVLGAGSGGYNTEDALAIVREEVERARHQFDRIEIVTRAWPDDRRAPDL